jgi:hypothetical protein
MTEQPDEIDLALKSIEAPLQDQLGGERITDGNVKTMMAMKQVQATLLLAKQVQRIADVYKWKNRTVGDIIDDLKK